jgi:hypothetical protein
VIRRAASPGFQRGLVRTQTGQDDPQIPPPLAVASGDPERLVTWYDARQREGDVLPGHIRAELPGLPDPSDQSAELLAQPPMAGTSAVQSGTTSCDWPGVVLDVNTGS